MNTYAGLEEGLAFYYPGSNALKDTVNGVSISNQGSTLVSSTVSPFARRLNGTDNYLFIASADVPDISEAFSLNMWIKSNSSAITTSNTPALYMIGDNVGGNELFLGFHALDETELLLLVNDDATDVTFDIGFSAHDTEWHMMTLTWDGTTVTCYVDGDSKGTANVSGTLDFGGSNFFIGTDTDSLNGDFGNYLQADVAEIGIWTRALSGDEVLALYNGGFPPQYPFTQNPFNTLRFVS